MSDELKSDEVKPSAELIQTVHAIPADFERELGHDADATTEAAKASSRVESNVTAPGDAPGKPIDDDHAVELSGPYPGAPVEYANDPSRTAETATIKQ